MDGTIRIRSVAWFATGVVLTLLATALVMQTWPANAAPGDEDATYVPISNCRLFDYRSGPDNVGPKSTPLGAGESNVYTQTVHGANGDCIIPVDATAVALNVTIANPTAQSNLRVFPADVATPDASNLNWLAGQSPTPNKVDVKLSPDGKIKLFNQNGTVDVIGDVVGYYTAKSLKELASGGTAGPQGPAGPQGDRGFSAWDKIPSGQTVTGSFLVDTHSETDGADYYYSVSMPARAASALDDSAKINFAADSDPVTTENDVLCTGTQDAPTAPAGLVCLYLVDALGVKDLLGLSLNSQLTDRGFRVGWSADGTSDMYVEFSWAYTAP